MTGKPVPHANSPFVSSDLPDADLLQLRDLLLARRRFDLGRYKDPCIRRRLAKRVRALGLPDLLAYLEVLRRDDGELDALLMSLTVHVSHFFRNPSTFAVLERTVLPALVAQARSAGRQEIRVWCAGCAAGEEPYSLAMVVDELAPARRVAILATDVNPEVLQSAREGLFAPMRLAEVPSAARERYFRPEGGGFRLDRRIRGMVEFARHDLLAPPAYPTADLILCRNVLIYFSRAEQENIFSRFAASLNPGGRLVLGKTENLSGPAREGFVTENLAERIYQRC